MAKGKIAEEAESSKAPLRSSSGFDSDDVDSNEIADDQISSDEDFGDDDLDNHISVTNKLELATPEEHAARIAKEAKKGVVYLTRVPPGMPPTKIKQLMSQYGAVGKIYLQPARESSFIAMMT